MPPADLTPAIAALAVAAFLAGGLVKGIVGIGLPMVVVPLLASVLPPPVAVAWMTVPVLASNLWQAFHARLYRQTFRRFWPLAVPLAVASAAGAQVLTRIDVQMASLVLGALVALFCIGELLPARVRVPERLERVLNPVVGVAAGLLGGVSNLFGPPIAVYLIALRLPKDLLVATAALCFLFGGVPLYASLAAGGVLGPSELAASALGAVPVLAGTWLGVRVRSRIDQRTFQRVLLTVLVLVGLNLMRRGLGL